MRGKRDTQVTMLSLVTANDLVPEDHPIRQIKPMVDKALAEQSVPPSSVTPTMKASGRYRHFLGIWSFSGV